MSQFELVNHVGNPRRTESPELFPNPHITDSPEPPQSKARKGSIHALTGGDLQITTGATKEALPNRTNTLPPHLHGGFTYQKEKIVNIWQNPKQHFSPAAIQFDQALNHNKVRAQKLEAGENPPAHRSNVDRIDGWIKDENRIVLNLSACLIQLPTRTQDANSNTDAAGNQLKYVSCQYPFSRQLKKHYSMLLEQNIPLLISAAAQKNDIENGAKLNKNKDMPLYYHDTNGKFVSEIKDGEGNTFILSDTEIKSSKIESGIIASNTEDYGKGYYDINYDVYELTIKRDKKEKTINVIHLNNLVDDDALSIHQMDQFDQLKSKYMSNDDADAMFAIHCRSGVGRATFIPLMSYILNNTEFIKKSGISLQELIESARSQRSINMVNYGPQLITLAETASKLGIPLYKDDVNAVSSSQVVLSA